MLGVEPIDRQDLQPWATPDARSYAGCYEFGVSEAGSEFTLVVSEGVVTAQIRHMQWVGDNKAHSVYRTLTNIRIVGRKFYSTEINGEFVRVPTEQVVPVEEARRPAKADTVYGLLVYKSWSASSPKGAAELGGIQHQGEFCYDGDYPQASSQVLTPAALAGYSKQQLTRMRNEIFARYGYTFSPGSEMRAYFQKQQWYQPGRKDVSQLLTAIEKRNIALLKSLEAAR